MKSIMCLLVLFGLTSALRAEVVDCPIVRDSDVERLTDSHVVSLSISRPIQIDKGDYKSGEFFELWMRSKSDKSRVINPKQEVKVERIELMDFMEKNDGLVFLFSQKAEVDRFVLYSRSETSAVDKLRESKELILSCKPKTK